ncbi:hypothetical protein Emag_001479 [Eimeria magna]
MEERRKTKASSSSTVMAGLPIRQLPQSGDGRYVDLSQFALWYSQAGTPHVRVAKASYDPTFKKFYLALSQYTPPTPGQPDKQPQVISMKNGLVGKDSKTDPLTPPTKVILLKKETQTVEFSSISEVCVPSLYRDFSAPIKLLYEQSTKALAFLMAHDSDPVNTSIAAQKLATSIIVARLAGADIEHPELPALEQEMNPADLKVLHDARRSVIMDVTSALKKEMIYLYSRLTQPEREQAFDAFYQEAKGEKMIGDD